MTDDLMPAIPAALAAGDGILLPAAIDAVKGAMTAYLDTTRAVLEPSDWQGPPNEAGSFVKKSGWQKVAKAYRLSTEIVSTEVDRDPDTGRIVRAGAIVRAVAPNGQYREATGYCDVDEPRFDRAAGRQKLENDLRNTAATRAENRAISNLCGLGAVSAEEMPDTAPIAATGAPTWTKSVSVSVTARQLEALLAAMGADPDQVHRIGNELFAHCDQTIPECVGVAFELLLGAAPDPVPAYDPDPQTNPPDRLGASHDQL